MFSVFFYDLVRTARRGRHTFIRFVYAGVLTLVLLIMYVYTIVPHVLPAIGSKGFFNGIWDTSAVPGRVLADFASTYFYVFASIQMVVVVLLTPPYVAGAIAEERERDTLEALFATHLRNDQIVFSLLLSRLTKLATILLAGIPILSFLQLLGGIDPDLVFAAFAATGMLTLSIASLGLLLSIYAGKARRAIVQTEVIAVGYLLVTIFIEGALKSPFVVRPGSFLLKPLIADHTLAEVLAWPGIGNPVVASYRLYDSLLPSTSFAGLLRQFLTEYVLFHLNIAVFCIVWSIFRIRAVALRDQQSALEQGTRRRRLSALGRWWRRAQLDAPLLWKGLVVDSRSPRRLSAWIFRGCGVALLFWPLAHVVYAFGRFRAFSDDDHLGWLVNDWCRVVSAFLGSAMLVVVGLRAASSISGERERQTLDSLLATPLRNRTIILHKWLSSIFAPRGWALLLVLIWVVSLAMGALHPAAIPAFVVAWLIDAAFLAAVGVWLSGVSSSTRRALLATSALALTVMVLLGIIVAYRWTGRDWQLFTLEPPVMLGVLAFSPADGHEYLSDTFQFWLGGVLFEQGLGVIGASVFFVLANLDFRKLTGRREEPASHDERPAAVSVGSAPGVEEYATYIRGIWPRGLLRFLLFLLPLVVLGGYYVIRSAEGEDKLNAMIAYLDRTDPGWRLDDIEAARRQIPDEQNSALLLREVFRSPYTAKPTNDVWLESFEGQAEMQLSSGQKAKLHQELQKISPLLRLRELADLPDGRFPVRFAKDGIGTDLSHCQDVRNFALALIMDAIDQCQNGNADGAVRSCRAVINASRAIGDEPASISQQVRMSIRMLAMLCLERILAQGQPSAGSLEQLQALLELDEPDPLLLTGIRGERAGFDRFLEAMSQGEVTSAALEYRPGRRPSQWSEDALVPVWAGSLKGQRAVLLDYYSQAVLAARLPTEQVKTRIAAITIPSAFDQPLVRHLLIALDRIVDSHFRSLAEVRCGIVALALERYRLATGHWPEALDQLVPGYLSKVPADPFTGTPLLYRKLSDGVLVYSVGVDGVDDGGKLNRKNHFQNLAGFDDGIRLWNVDKRGQPFREK